MSKSNWKGSSGWGAIDDPTGVLNGRVLVGAAGVSSITEDYLTQLVGTSTTFDKVHYSVKMDYAWPSTADFASGTLGLISRASNYQGDPLQSYDCYVGQLSENDNTVKIIRRVSNDESILVSAVLDENAVSKGPKHTIELRTYGTNPVNIQLLLDNNIVASVGDLNANRLTSGDPGILVSSGTVYLDNFAVLEYTQDGEAPADWIPTSIATTGLTLMAWYNAQAGVTGTTVTAWADQSGNANDASASTGPIAIGNAINGLTMLRFDGSSQHLTVAHNSTLDINTGNNISIFALVDPTFASARHPIVDKGSNYKFGLEDSLGVANDAAFFAGTTNVFSADASVTNNAAQIIGFISGEGFYIDGTAGTTTSVTVGTINTGSLQIGLIPASSVVSASYFQGDIAEIILVEGQLGTSDRQKLEGYLAQKYATWPRLPASHPYKYVTPTQ